ncbi:UDP-glucosyltransferase 2-like isoform X2 [Phymastichus coffea]|uniref:UDP-glucosyltransferase 2-like isoform X2 n=1 Tax=Phymastichus coffea TaxID=108790 RepID=UPI00273B826A|nr:UDP-glucosyltransferase 2-like isoform X2 [Phymastichus coffea]
MAVKVLLVISTIVQVSHGYNVLLATMGGTRSHTVPFVALGTALVERGHNVTLASGFSGPAANNGLKELVPPRLETYIGNYTSEWDLVGSRFRNELPISPWDAMRYGWEACEALLTDGFYLSEVQRPEGNSRAQWDVVVIDGAYPECLLGVLHGQQVPTIMLNTVALYSGSLARQGNPSPWSIRPYFGKALTQDMNFAQRILNVSYLSILEIMHWIMITGFIQPTLRKHLGEQVPDVRELVSEVPLTLQNNHYSVSDSTPYLSNVVNVACIQCRAPLKLGPEMDTFLSRGFVFVSMGSSVKASGMPEALRKMFVAVFSTLPYNVVWKWEGGTIEHLPSNVRTAAWWPQQELLGHNKLKAFVSHGGLLSLHEAAYHAAPTLVLPVFCDHDGNAAQAEKLGYALVTDLASLTITVLRESIMKVAAGDTKNLAVWWVEHIARHKGADHLKSTSRHMSVGHYYSLDVAGFYLALFVSVVYGARKLLHRAGRKKLKEKLQ